MPKCQNPIIFAVPSYNEADNIEQIVKIIDQGLCQYFPEYQNIIVNADNDSPDRTKKVFLNTKTRCKKIYLSSKGLPGKGVNIKNTLEYAKETSATALGFIDSDVTSAKPEWVKKIIKPILEGYDHILPIYLRNKYDGSITNHLIFPVLYGLLSANIRQPLAGEIGLSLKAISIMLNPKWYPSAFHYGVDIFLVTQSIFNNLKIAQTFLGIKAHKPSAPKLDPMFLQVTDSLFRQLNSNKSFWQTKNMAEKEIKLLIKPLVSDMPKLVFNYREMQNRLLAEYNRHQKQITPVFASLKLNTSKIINKKTISLNSELWAKIVYKILKGKKIPLSKSNLLALRVLFFARFLTFYQETVRKTYKSTEQELFKQAKIFKQLRNAIF